MKESSALRVTQKSTSSNNGPCKNYTPKIDWKLFRQGPISDDVWELFRKVVLYAHIQKHWKTSISPGRHSRLRGFAGELESVHIRKKCSPAHPSEPREEDMYVHAAAFQQAQFLWNIAAVVQYRAQSADWRFGTALFLAVGLEIFDRIGGHERADMAVLAFNKFDGDLELTSDPATMAARWRIEGIGSICDFY